MAARPFEPVSSPDVGETRSFVLRLYLDWPGVDRSGGVMVRVEAVETGEVWRFTAIEPALSSLQGLLEQITGADRPR